MRERCTAGINRVVVLGANGTMGYGSAALFTRACVRVTFLARTLEKAREGLAAAIAQVRSPTVAERAEIGTYDADLERVVPAADLIFEALTERLDVKRAMFERVDALRRDDAIVATVTSGLSIDALAEGRSESFRRRFLGLHFFNPPNVIVGTELIAGRDTEPAVMDRIEEFARSDLGRAVVRTSDTAGFAGNRVGFKVLNEVVQLAEEHGPLLMDRLVGPYTGRALPPLATVDLVGWDIHEAIVDNLWHQTEDEARLLAKGVRGVKSGGGFFRKDEDRKLVLRPGHGDYVPVSEVSLPDLSFIDRIAARHRIGDYRGAMRELALAEGPWAALARKVVAGYVSYAFHRAGEVTDSIEGIDRIMGLGFNWAPPSVLVDTIGPEATARMMEEAGVPVPRAIDEARRTRVPVRFHERRELAPGRYFVAA